MASRGPGSVLAGPRCSGSLQNNGTCAEQLLFPPFSSTLALIVLVLVLVGIVLVSLATLHFHKRKLRKRKILRAQEEYERDRRSPARAPELVRPCIIRCESTTRCEDSTRCEDTTRCEEQTICEEQTTQGLGEDRGGSVLEGAPTAEEPNYQENPEEKLEENPQEKVEEPSPSDC